MRAALCILAAALCVGSVSSLMHEVQRFTQMLKQGDGPCAHCKAFVADIKERLKEGTTQEGAIDYVDNVLCKELPSSFVWQQSCKFLAEGFVPQLLDLGSENIKPQAFCADSMFCSPTFDEEFEELVKDVKKYVGKFVTKHHLNI